MKQEDTQEGATSPLSADPPLPGPKATRRRKSPARKKKSSDWQFLLVLGLVVFGGGFLVARFILELPVWQSVLAAPVAFLALVVTLATWSWFTPAGRRRGR